MAVQPYLFFDGRCEEAVNFYQSALGAKLEMLMRYKDSPDPLPPELAPPGTENKVMHASMTIGGDMVMACDDCNPKGVHFKGFALHVGLPTTAEVDRAFAALAEGGNVDMPLGKTFWSPRFGMVTDRFGVGWMISIAE